MSILFYNEKQLSLQIPYPDTSGESHLQNFRETYKPEALIDKSKTDFQNVIQIQAWVEAHWEIIEANPGVKYSEKFQNFKCHKLSAVTCEYLKALGFTVRNLWLKCVDAEEKNGGKGHMLKEVYLHDLKKWFLIDPEFDIMITKDNQPLNAVELQQALLNEEELEILNTSEKISSEEYLEWIGSYLFCFTTSLNKGSISFWDRLIGRKKKLTLVPLGEETPGYLQRLRQARTNLITNSLADFYPGLLSE